ncbi:MAG: hypothetical protein H7332_01160 [Bdellovibrionales bacterium]|nr:hypothetical protein [Ramlibacter sp.]
MKRIALLSLLLLTGLLSGCASTWMVDSKVQTFSSLPAVPANAAYRFERLPSQRSYGEQQAKLEAIAEQALSRVGLRRDDAAARLSVQIGARAQREASPWQDTWPGMGGDYTVTATGQIVWTQPFARPELPWFRREVSLIIRDLGNNQIAYETLAVHEGRWADSTLVLPAMYEAALRDFPQATQGVKKVNITVPLR